MKTPLFILAIFGILASCAPEKPQVDEAKKDESPVAAAKEQLMDPTKGIGQL
jgi:hypothetical protein